MKVLFKTVLIYLFLLSLVISAGYFLLGILPNFYEMIILYFICELSVKQDNLKRSL